MRLRVPWWSTGAPLGVGAKGVQGGSSTVGEAGEVMKVCRSIGMQYRLHLFHFSSDPLQLKSGAFAPSLEGGRGEAVLETPGTYTEGAEPLIPEFTGTASTLLQEISCLLGCTTFSTVSISVRVLSKCWFAAVVDVVYLSASPLLADTWGFRLCLVFLIFTGFPAFTSRDHRLRLLWRNRRCA